MFLFDGEAAACTQTHHLSFVVVEFCCFLLMLEHKLHKQSSLTNSLKLPSVPAMPANPVPPPIRDLKIRRRRVSTTAAVS